MTVSGVNWTTDRFKVVMLLQGLTTGDLQLPLGQKVEEVELRGSQNGFSWGSEALPLLGVDMLQPSMVWQLFSQSGCAVAK